jgi:hypothetical protein
LFYNKPILQNWPNPRRRVNANWTAEERQATADKQKEAQKAFNDAKSTFSLRLFYVSAPLGDAALLIGGFMAVSTVGTGLIFGGIFSIINGYWIYWEFIPDWERFVSLLVAGAILLLIAYRKVPKPNKKGLETL